MPRLPLQSSRTLDAHGRLVAAASVLLLAALVASLTAHASDCGQQHDVLVRGDPLFATVTPADCATLLSGGADFTWPAQPGASAYAVTLTFPDGHAETLATDRNWLAWNKALPPGAYRWSVRVDGRRPGMSAQRTFTIDGRAAPTVALGSVAGGKATALN